MFFLGKEFQDNSFSMVEIEFTVPDMLELLKFIPDQETAKARDIYLDSNTESDIYSYANGNITLKQLRRRLVYNPSSDLYKAWFFIKYEDLPLLIDVDNYVFQSIVLPWRFHIGK